jgi:hypothetical protein
MIDWNEERDYILSIRPSAVGDTFNNDFECFQRYCRMQANSAYKVEEYTIGLAIIHHANIEEV